MLISVITFDNIYITESHIFLLIMHNHCLQGILGLALDRLPDLMFVFCFSLHRVKLEQKRLSEKEETGQFFSKDLFFRNVPVLLNRCHLPPYHPTKRHRLSACFIFTFLGHATSENSVFNKWNNSWVVIKNETFSHFLSLD